MKYNRAKKSIEFYILRSSLPLTPASKLPENLMLFIQNSYMNKAPFKNEIHTLSAILLYLGFLLFATSFFKCCCLTTTKSEESLLLHSS